VALPVANATAGIASLIYYLTQKIRVHHHLTEKSTSLPPALTKKPLFLV
jgi:hypothetical protein